MGTDGTSLPDRWVERVALRLPFHDQHPDGRTSLKAACCRRFKCRNPALVRITRRFERIDDLPRMTAIDGGGFVLAHRRDFALDGAAMPESIQGAPGFLDALPHGGNPSQKKEA